MPDTISGARITAKATIIAALISASVAVFVPYLGTIFSIDGLNNKIAKLETKINSLESEILEVPVGTIIPYAGNGDLPNGFLLCNGKEHSQETYPKLYAIIKDSFGSADLGLFKIPDLQGRTPIGAGLSMGVDESGKSLIKRTFGKPVGVEINDQVPTHKHRMLLKRTETDTGTTLQGHYRKKFVVIDDVTVDVAQWDDKFTEMNEGGNDVMNNVQPSLAVNFIIKAE